MALLAADLVGDKLLLVTVEPESNFVLGFQLIKASGDKSEL